MSSYLRHFVPFGEFVPDAPEFDPEYMERVANFLPVYSGYRPVLRLEEISRETDDPISGTFAMRTTEDLGIDVLTPIDPVLASASNAYPVPDTRTIPQVLGGLQANDQEYLRQEATGVELETAGPFSLATQPYDGAGNITLNYRYRVRPGTGAYSMRLAMGWLVGAVRNEADFDTIAGTLDADGDDIWKAGTLVIPVASFTPGPDLTDDELYYELKTTADLQPLAQFLAVSDLAVNGYVAVGQPSLWQALGTLGDDAQYIQSPTLLTGAQAYCNVGLADIGDPVLSGHNLRVRAVGIADMKLRARILEDVEGELFERTADEVTIVNDTITDYDFPLSGLEMESIVDFANLQLELGFIGAAGHGNTKYSPTAISYDGEFTKFGAGTDHGVLGDADDGTGWRSSKDTVLGGSILDSLTGNLNAVDPGQLTGHVFRFRVQSTGGSSTAQMRLFNGSDSSEVAASGNKVFGSGFQWFDINLTQGEAGSIIDYSQLTWRLDRRDGSQGATTEIAEVELQLPASGSAGRVHEAYFEAPGQSGVDVSWLRGDGDLPQTFLPGDVLKIYAGTPTNLWELRAEDNWIWDNVSWLTGSYSSVGAKSWSITDWGDKVIATNYKDPVQVKNIGDTEFRDLYGFDNAGVAIPDYGTDGFVYPRGRFVATINAFHCLANVDPASYVDGKAFTFWCSAIGDPTRMHPADSNTQSALFQLVATRGEITGMVGGERGLLFKEDSAYRVDYVGFPVVFNFHHLSILQGCPYPRSIVRRGADTYFWGAGGIFAIRDGDQLVEVGANKIHKFLFDAMFESLSLGEQLSTDVRDNDSKVIGDYDPYSGCIYWAYKTDDDPFFENGAVVVYNPTKDWATILLADDIVKGSFDLTGVCSVGNRARDTNFLARALFLFERDSGDNVLKQFSGSPTYPGQMVTNTLSSSTFPQVPPGREIELAYVRPIQRTEPGTTPPQVTLTIQAGQHPIIEQRATSQVVTTTEQNLDAWIPLKEPLSGEFFKVTADTAEAGQPSLKELLGVQFKYRVAGGF